MRAQLAPALAPPRRLPSLEALAPLADRRLAAFLLGAVPVTAFGAANGGYYPASWSWGSLVFLWLAGLALALERETSFGRQGAAFAALALALTAWTAGSALWSSDLTATGLATERELLYAATVLGAFVVVRRSSMVALLAGLWCGIVLICGYGLLTRLLPDRIGLIDPTAGYRLAGPIGYWNSFGLLAAMGILLALGLAARARAVVLRALAAATIPVLASAVYYTFSRGAWFALALAFVAMVSVERARLQLLLVALVAAWPGAVAAFLSGSKRPLTTTGYPLGAQAHSGHRLAIELALLAAAGAASVVVLSWLEPRVLVPRAARVAAGAAIVLLLVAGAAELTVRVGAPWSAVARGWHTFTSSSVNPGANLNGRLLSLASPARATQWHVAWEQARAHPWLGGGAGTWADYWVAHRPRPSIVHNVHNLYLETLSELGPVGLALLAGMLGVPLMALRRARREPLASTAAAAYVAFLLHAVVDWDWQLAGVTLPFLLCGVAMLAAGQRERIRLRPPVRTAVVGVVALLLAASVYGATVRVELARAGSAAAAGRWPDAERLSRRAASLEPWSSEAWHRLGDAALAAGDDRVARVAYTRAVARDAHDWELWLGLARSSTGITRATALYWVNALNPRGGLSTFRAAETGA